MAPKAKLWELYRTLDEQLDDGEYESSIETADRILSMDSKEDLALRSKIFALAHLGRFQEASTLLKDEDGESEDVIFAKAYAFYKEKRFKDSLDLILSYPDLLNTLSISHLKAQCYYRLEDYEECFKQYQRILDHFNDYSPETLTNYLASLIEFDKSQGQSFYKSHNDKIKDYEALYNASFLYSESGELGFAKTLLNSAKESCSKALNDDDIDKESYDDDISIILAQSAYVSLLRGEKEKVLETFESVSNNSGSNMAAIITSVNNISSLNSENLNDAYKKVKGLLDNQYADKMTVNQRLVIQYNLCVLSLKLCKYQDALEIIKALKESLSKREIKFGPTLAHVTLLLAHYYYHSGDIEGRKEFIAQCEEKLINQNQSTIKYMEKREKKGFPEVRVKKEKKQRKNKPAKKADFSKPPDPERWLPRKDRSYTKRRAKNARSTGHQGSKVEGE